MKRTFLLIAFSLLLAGILALPSAVEAIPVPLDIENPGFEEGDASIPGWDLVTPFGYTNAFGVVSSQIGTSPSAGQSGSTHFVSGRALGMTTPTDTTTELGISQRVDVSMYAAQIDLGLVTLMDLTGYGYGETGGTPDAAYMRIGFFDAVTGGNPMGSTYQSNSVNQQGSWAQMQILDVDLLGGTRSIEVYLLADKKLTNYCDVGFDSISGTLDVVPEPATMLLLGSGLIGLAGLGRKRFFKKA